MTEQLPVPADYAAPWLASLKQRISATTQQRAHQIALIDKLKTRDERIWYAAKATEAELQNAPTGEGA